MKVRACTNLITCVLHLRVPVLVVINKYPLSSLHKPNNMRATSSGACIGSYKLIFIVCHSINFIGIYGETNTMYVCTFTLLQAICELCVSSHHTVRYHLLRSQSL